MLNILLCSVTCRLFKIYLEKKNRKLTFQLEMQISAHWLPQIAKDFIVMKIAEWSLKFVFILITETVKSPNFYSVENKDLFLMDR